MREWQIPRQTLGSAGSHANIHIPAHYRGASITEEQYAMPEELLGAQVIFPHIGGGRLCVANTAI